MITQLEIQTGMKVTFVGRGKCLEGTVTRIRIKNRRKLAQLESRLGVNSGMSRTMVAEISVIGSGLWTVPVHSCTVVAAAKPEEIEQAHEHVNGIKSSISNAIYARKNRNFEAANNNGLLNLKANDPIEIKFRDIGWAPRFFIRWTTTGTVIYRDRYNQERRCKTQFVRLPRPAEEIKL